MRTINPRKKLVAEDRWSGKASSGATWTLHCGDAAKVLDQAPKNRYSCVITSPPYFWQRDYGVRGQIGIEPSVDGYVSAICDTMDKVRHVLRPDGVLFLNLGDTYYSGKGQPHGNDSKHRGRRFSVLRAVDKSGLGPPKKTILGMPWRVALEMIDRGWILRAPIVWRRKHAIPEPSVRDRPRRSYEFIFVFAKSRKYNFSRSPLVRAQEEDVWTIESTSKVGREHPAVFPAGLVERCLALGNPKRGRVLDPFAGSGTVLSVALEQGIAADGIELSRPFCGSIIRTLRAQ